MKKSSWEVNSHSASQEKPEISLPCSQGPATNPYPEPDESSPQLLTYIPKIHSNVILPSTHISSDWHLPFRFSD